MARAWFFLVLLNSSSFSATRLSISCLTCPSSSWARRTLFSSCSRVPSASSRHPCSSSFSCSRRRLCLSRSWMERPPRTRLLSSWTSSSARTRTSPTRSRTFSTSLVRAAAPSTTWTSRDVALSRRRRSCRELLRRPRALSSRRRTRCFVPSWSLDRSSRRLTGAWQRRRRSSTTPGRTTLVPWSPCPPLLRPSRRPSVRRYQAQLKETIQLYEDEARSRSQIMEQVGISERKAAALSGELEESKALMDSSERAKRQLEMEIADGRNAVNNMQVINGRDMTAKRGLEGAIHTIQAEVDAMLGAAKNAEEKSKKAMVDAARLADELRAEQDHASSQASSKQSLNNQLGQLEARLADAENAAAKGGKAAMAKLENKVHELEAELAGTQDRTGEAAKAYQRAERKCKELVFSSGEDKKNQDRMTDLASKLQSKIKTYKQQIEEAEEIAALNLAKFRKAQQELEEVEERAKLAALI